MWNSKDVYYISDSTGILITNLGQALICQFPEINFNEEKFPFIRTAASRQSARRSSRISSLFITGPSAILPSLFYRKVFFEIPSSCRTWVAVSSMDLPAVLTTGILFFWKRRWAWCSSSMQVVRLA